MLILEYHRVTDLDRGALAVPTAAFREQLQHLLGRGYRNVSLHEAAPGLAEGRDPGRRAFAVTFDDGYRDNYLHALPVLRELGLKATLFLPCRYVGAEEVFPWDCRRAADWGGVREEDLPVTWGHLREMRAGGVFDFGSHTVSHVLLTRVGRPRAAAEITQSKRVLEDALGQEVRCFCYPAGDVDRRVIPLVREAGYRVGVVTPPRRVPRSVYTLRRVGVYGHTGARAFRIKTGLPFQLLMRIGLWPPRARVLEGYDIPS
jgi:peptidoglycan/xylan/chitin deacetylase (PgdA/CDA1 family)